MGGNGDYAQIGGLRMYYEVHGEAREGRPPLVLLHGAGSTIDTTYGELIPLLTGDRQVVGVEEQGHGHTPSIDRPFTFENSADDVAALLGQLGIAQADVVGFSNGGGVALKLATRHPALVRRLVLASAPFRRDGMVEGFWDGMEHASLEAMPAVYQDAYRSIDPDPRHLRQMFDLDRVRMLTLEDWPDEELAAVAAPTLVVAGDQDVITVEHAAALARLIPGGRLLVLPGNHGDYLGEVAASAGDTALLHLTAPFLVRFLDQGA
jgi:pimeloyl-ACP methyl ester carboxylesterase